MKTPFVFAEFRKSLGLTQEEFAEKCGATVRSVQNWEQGGTITPQAMKLFRYIEAEILSGRKVSAEDQSLAISGSNNRASLTEQTTFGDNSPAVCGDNNNLGCGGTLSEALATIDRLLDELSAQRTLVERSMAQTDRVLSLLETQKGKA